MHEITKGYNDEVIYVHPRQYLKVIKSSMQAETVLCYSFTFNLQPHH